MKRPQDFKTALGGVEWSVYFVRKGHHKVPGAYGMCYWDAREIYVRYDMAEATVKNTLIHELLHGTCRLLFVAEEWVDLTATELERGLRNAGM